MVPIASTPEPPTLVLLPGLDGTRFLFEPFLRAWGSEAMVVTYPTTLPSDYDTLLPLVLAALPKGRDFVLLGWSFSGPLALMAAATRPERLKGVVLCASFVEKPLPWVPVFARHFTWPVLFGFTGSLAIAKTALAGYGSKEVNALIGRAHDAVPSAVMAARVREVLTVDVRDELVQCPVPVLYLEAARDRIVPRRNLERIQQMRPDVLVRTIPGPHIALAIHPIEAAEAIRRFP
ncbi:Alpha/beta hydrolase family protein [Planctomycetes bacterium Poly30]|uniref:Alpha/beta hydrolase family protein n=1 Tax=Saltatorellus ferox TaxID=2528018 RepID=A0A518EXU5_9BACT|nr:Alpha/beta hydrolase family protein [Planctomycetes bacterium Poly30]